MMSTTTLAAQRPVAPEPSESRLLRELDTYRRPEANSAARLIGPDGTEFELPESMYEVLRQAAHQLAAGNAVSIVPVGVQLSTQQAAELLGVSRPHLIKLLEADAIPYTKVGKHRRVQLNDVLAYRDELRVRRSDALDRLSRLSSGIPFI